MNWLKKNAEKKPKERKPAEESLFLRMLWLALTFTCFYLIALVDPGISSLNIGAGLKIPLLFIYFWVAVSGSYLSYQNRHKDVKWLEYCGLVIVAFSCFLFIANMQIQLMTGTEMDILLPTVHLVTGMYVSHSFELRTRFDFNFSLAVSLIIVCYCAALGKGAWFGAGMFVYVVLAATLLLLDCEARTFGSVQERSFGGIDSALTFRNSGGSEKTANLVVPTFSLLLLSICFFLAVPRAESLADQIAAKVYSVVRNALVPPGDRGKSAPKVAGSPLLSKRTHLPAPPPRKGEQTKGDGKNAAGASSTEANDEKADNNADSKDSGSDNSDSKDPDSKGTGGTSKAKNHLHKTKESASPYSRSAEKAREDKKKLAKEARKGAESSVTKDDFKPGDESGKAKGSNKDKSSAANDKDLNGKGKDSKGIDGKGRDGKDINGAGKSYAEKNGTNKKEHNGDKREPESNKRNADLSNEGNGHGTEKDKNGKGNSSTPSKGAQKATDKNNHEKNLDPTQRINPGKESDSKDPLSNLRKKGSSVNPQANAAGKNAKGNNQGANGQPKKNQKQQEDDRSRTAPRLNNSTAYPLPDTLDVDAAGATGDEEIFSVTCNRTVPFRQGAFDSFDGRQWHVSPEIEKADIIHSPNSSFNVRNFFKQSSDVPSIRLTQKFHVLRNLGNKIIFAGTPTEIAIASPTQLKIDSCGNLKGGWPLIKGLEYTVFADLPLYDIESMRKDGVPPEADELAVRARLQKFTQIPGNQSDELYALSHKIAGAQDNWFVQAERICSYLRHTCQYSGDLKYKTLVDNSVDRFLFDNQTGDCKDFAAAFVIMCRASGIPARFVVGYSNGDFDPSTGTRLIKSKNTHAWGEIYYPSVGWIPFDSTPDGVLPAQKKEEERYFSTMGQKVEESLEKAKVIEGESPDGKKAAVQVPLPNGKKLSIQVDFVEVAKLIALMFGAVVLSGPLIMLLKKLKVTNKFHWPQKVHPASKIYANTLKDLRSVGVDTAPSQTPGEFLDKLRENLAGQQDIEKSQRLSEAVEDFINCYNATYYGSRDSMSDLEKKRQSIRDLLKHQRAKK